MSTQHTYRVIVRGAWRGLTDTDRARLLADVEGHGLAGLRFTPEGSLAYDRTLNHFSYRYEIVADADDGEEMAALLAEERAARALAALGYDHGELRSTATDMDTMKINRPSRR
ncbi:DUF6204 family protein [Streptomyces montanisoli]|uniref:Uncharacterized protein n=1 Tax=Streptomyces montanisoli TaxID=2798581 RepID=A0A940RXG5_9ACTN|nr:DUF6204 family protein [Streptomyces montanisoli]MBP0458123.1 hypothetical protein [Streptomyces montanisoli]